MAVTLLLMTASTLEADALESRLEGHPRPTVIGVGPIAAALGASRALAACDELPGACVLIGLAGTRDPERLPVGAALVADAVFDEAVGAGHGADFTPLDAMGLPAADVTPERLELVAGPPDLVPEPPWTVGALGTVAAASADADEAAARRARRPEVLAEEMEGHAVALACREAGAPLAVIRGVCNVAGDRDHRGWRLDAAYDALGRATDTWLQAMREL